MAKVKILKEVPQKYDVNDWTLCFQWCEYIYDDGEPSQNGYRFIWRRPDGSLQAARGQARIPSVAEMKKLLQLAGEAGWLEKVENNFNNKQ